MSDKFQEKVEDLKKAQAWFAAARERLIACETAYEKALIEKEAEDDGSATEPVDQEKPNEESEAATQKMSDSEITVSQTPAPKRKQDSVEAPQKVEAVVKRARSEPLTIYCDGSATNNGGANAKAGAAFVCSNGVRWCGRVHGRQTNIRAELYAAMAATVYAQKIGCNIIYTDSDFVIKGIEEETRLRKWVTNGWTRADGGPVANVDLWQCFHNILSIGAAKGHNVRFIWVEGHSGVAGNEEADKLAKVGGRRPLPVEGTVDWPNALLGVAFEAFASAE